MKLFALLFLSVSCFAQSFFSDGAIRVISSSHQDIGWEDTPAACAAYRDASVITPALELLTNNPGYCYSVEASLSLLEYLHRHPNRAEEIQKFVESGRLEWGATFNQPYESMYYGEALIRQTYFGRKLLQKYFPHSNPRVYWNVDVPGRAMQMPQILAKSGVDYMIMSRHGEGFYRWGSPDGSSVVAWSPGHYYNASRRMMEKSVEQRLVFQDMEKIAATYEKYLDEWTPYYQQYKLPPQVGALLSRDMFTPMDLDDFFAEWNETMSPRHQLPKMHYSTIEQFLDKIMAGNPELKEIVGERPNLWLYIHGPTHHKALTAGREASRLLVAAEKFATIDALLQRDWSVYPQAQLEIAWMDAIYPDHGWGGVNGHITDRVFREKFESARDAGSLMLDAAVRSIAGQVEFKDTGIPIVAFNPMSWKRTEPVVCVVNVEGRAYPYLGTDLNVKVVDMTGQRISHQVLTGQGGDGSDEELRITFVAADVPSIGYKTYYLVLKDSADVDEPAKTQPENDFYRIEFAPGGLSSIYDKELKKEILNTDKFLGGELFTMQSIGEGAGEWSQVQQPDMTGFEKASDYRPHWNLVESGPVRSAWEFTQRIDHVTLRQRVLLYHTVKRIDFETELLGWDGTAYREFRLAFPLNMKKYNIAYEAPMGVVEVGQSEIKDAAGKSASYINYSQPCSTVHPREVQDWFHADNGDWGVTISSSVAVFDWIDPTDNPVEYPVLQPLLLASRRSCNGRGNWYLQAGDHFFRFSLTSHKNDWRGHFQQSVGAAQPMVAVVGPVRAGDAHLPEAYSFFSINQPNAIISAIKKCDDSDNVILRLYDIEGRKSNVSIGSFKPIADIQITNMIEKVDKSKVAMPAEHGFNLGAYSIETAKLKFEDE